MNKLINIFICTLFLSLTSCSAVYQYNDNELSLMHTDLTKAKEFKVSGKIAIIEKKRISSYININVIGDDYLIYLNDKKSYQSDKVVGYEDFYYESGNDERKENHYWMDSTVSFLA